MNNCCNCTTSCDQTLYSITVVGIAKVGGFLPFTAEVTDPIGPVYGHVLYRREGVEVVGSTEEGELILEPRWIEEEYWVHPHIGDIYKHEIRNSCDGVIYSWQLNDDGSESESSTSSTCNFTLPTFFPVITDGVDDTYKWHRHLREDVPGIYIFDQAWLSEERHPPTLPDAEAFMDLIDLSSPSTISVEGVGERTTALGSASSIALVYVENSRTAAGVQITYRATPADTVSALNTVGIVGNTYVPDNGVYGNPTAWTDAFIKDTKTTRFLLMAGKVRLAGHDPRVVLRHYSVQYFPTMEDERTWPNYFASWLDHTSTLEKCQADSLTLGGIDTDPCSAAPTSFTSRCVSMKIYRPENVAVEYGYATFDDNCHTLLPDCP